MIRNFITIFFVSCLLAGCSRQRNALYYAKYPEKLKTVLLHCNTMGASAFSNVECKQAANSYKKLVSFGDKLIQDPPGFGKLIISEQVKLANLEEKLNRFSAVENESEINALKEKIQALRKNLKLKVFLAGKAAAV